MKPMFIWTYMYDMAYMRWPRHAWSMYTLYMKVILRTVASDLLAHQLILFHAALTQFSPQIRLKKS